MQASSKTRVCEVELSSLNFDCGRARKKFSYENNRETLTSIDDLFIDYSYVNS